MRILPPQGALTTTYNGRARELHCIVNLSPTGELFNPTGYDGLWDTGATNTVVSQKIVDELKLQPIGMTQAFTPQGYHNTPTYLIDLFFKDSKLKFAPVRVTLGKLSNCEVLIGMDVIGFGDLAVTNKDGNTVVSFRAPSFHVVDYVQIMEQQKKGHFAPPKNRKKKRH